MNDQRLEIVFGDQLLENILAVVFLVLACVIVYTFLMNLSMLLRRGGAAANPALFRWRLQLSLAASCIAAMLTVLDAFQGAILLLFMAGSDLSSQTIGRELSAPIQTIWAGWSVAIVGMIQYFWLDLWAKRIEMRKTA